MRDPRRAKILSYPSRAYPRRLATYSQGPHPRQDNYTDSQEDGQGRQNEQRKQGE